MATIRPATLYSTLSRRKHPLFLLAGPCVIESEALCLEIARFLAKATRKLQIPFVFKASYDKANRSSIDSFRGPGIEKGLAILDRIKSRVDVPVITDVHTEAEAKAAGEVVDILQIPAFLSRQTDLLQAAALTKCIINIKKGQFAAPQDMSNVISKIHRNGNRRIVLTERGSTFGYQNLVADMRSIPIMQQCGHPVVFDATHSVQLPGAGGNKSSGQREYAPILARAAVAAGADGIFLETHPDPEQSLSDGPNMVPLKEVSKLMAQLIRIRQALG